MGRGFRCKSWLEGSRHDIIIILWHAICNKLLGQMLGRTFSYIKYWDSYNLPRSPSKERYFCYTEANITISDHLLLIDLRLRVNPFPKLGSHMKVIDVWTLCSLTSTITLIAWVPNRNQMEVFHTQQYYNNIIIVKFYYEWWHSTGHVLSFEGRIR